ncbi:hypothetical protein NKI39_15740 [Mesorhizobium sp. M0664]|uniref:hypothetical protein n=1 Tax=Mesorhizobium sp. M0664 TaxID=2956982 RepID=UPI00333CF728
MIAHNIIGNVLTIVLGLSAQCAFAADQLDNIYQTYGVHNPPSDSPCANADCAYTRAPGEPTDPLYPEYWSSDWNMYRVFNNASQYPPPYDGAPPPALKAGQDYEISKGASYYDSTWSGPTGQGAMMEHYEKRCLPIFPISNQFTCSFISLGDVAFFVTYESDRPKGMPPVCLFSPVNHAPRRDFIRHLPYSASDSKQLKNAIQGYSFWVDAATGKPIQVGVSPDRTADQAIMFGYGFMSKAMPDRVDRSAKPFRHPQSFYFSGYPMPPANAPFVSQNYTNLAMVKPDPKATWDLVSKLDPNKLQACQLFNPPADAVELTKTPRVPTWGDIKHQDEVGRLN